MCATFRKVRPESIACNPLQVVFIGEWGYGNVWISVVQGFIEEDKVSETPTDIEFGLGEGLEI